MLANSIFESWQYQLPNRWSRIEGLEGEFSAWAMTLADSSRCVALPYDQSLPRVNEEFSDVRLFSELAIQGFPVDAILVLSSSEGSRAFAALCAEFVTPGQDGSIRESVLRSPVSWWNEWKMLLGNKAVDSRVYDVLGELVSLSTLISMGYAPVWSGPTRATADIRCGLETFEVKSTTLRSSKTVSMHGLYQAASAGEMKRLIFCRFEAAEAGVSINSVVARLVEQGFGALEVEESLAALGYPKGKSARDQHYALLALIQYEMDDRFPGITPGSFVGGDLPAGVLSVSYTISLDGLEGRDLLRFFEGNSAA